MVCSVRCAVPANAAETLVGLLCCGNHAGPLFASLQHTDFALAAGCFWRPFVLTRSLPEQSTTADPSPTSKPVVYRHFDYSNAAGKSARRQNRLAARSKSSHRL